MGRLVACVLGSLGPRAPGGRRRAGPGLEAPGAPGLYLSLIALSKKSLKIFCREKRPQQWPRPLPGGRPWELVALETVVAPPALDRTQKCLSSPSQPSAVPQALLCHCSLAAPPTPPPPAPLREGPQDGAAQARVRVGGKREAGEAEPPQHSHLCCAHTHLRPGRPARLAETTRGSDPSRPCPSQSGTRWPGGPGQDSPPGPGRQGRRAGARAPGSPES